MLKHDFRFVANESDDEHCFQSSVRMAWEGLRGVSLSREKAEELTGFEPGRQTWPFQGMLALAEAGLVVNSVEDFDPGAFVRNPRTEILRQCGDPAILEHVDANSDIDSQSELVRQCLAHSRISFETRVPSLENLRQGVERPATAVICNVNYRALAGEDGYNGHFVLVTSVDDAHVALENPGLPPIQHQVVSHETFVSSWAAPSPSLANFISLYLPVNDSTDSPDHREPLSADEPIVYR